MTPDPLALCPFCRSPNVERHHTRQADGRTDPGCLSCERTAPMEEWSAAVLAVGASKQQKLQDLAPASYRVPFSDIPVGARFRHASSNYTKTDDGGGADNFRRINIPPSVEVIPLPG